MFFINILFIIHNLSSNLIDVINSKLTISLYLKDEYDKDHIDVKWLLWEIQKTTPNVITTFKTKEEVLEEMKEKDPELVSIIKAKNPLPSTIILWNIKIDEYKKLDYIINQKLFILSNFKTNTIYDYKTQYERIDKIIQILQTLKIALYFIIAIFLLSIFVITYSIIWNFIFYYRDEIYITKLVWWKNYFIYWPFMLQWIIYAILWFIVSFNIFLIIINNVWFVFDKEVVSRYIINNDLYYILLMQFIVFIIIWALSSFLSSRKYINN